MHLTFDQARLLGIDVDSVLAANPLRRDVASALPTDGIVQSGPGWWCVTIDEWRPATDNELHKSVKEEIRLKQRDRKVLRDYLVDVARCSQNPVGRREVFLTVSKRRKPLPDPANFFKSFLDALVQINVLRDDSREWAKPHTPNVHVDARLPVSVRTIVHIRETCPLCRCCDRSEEYNGFGSDGPLLFRCPKDCPCHD